jgi:hypothetical protein
MKTSAFASVVRLTFAALVGVGLASCTVYDESYYSEGPRYAGGYAGAGYGPGYYDDWGAEYYDYHPPMYRSYVSYSSYAPYYYGGRYYNYRWWDDDRYRNYCHDHGSNHDRYRKRRSGEEMKLVRYRGPERGDLPSGYHSKEWYRDRGYSLKDNTYREEDGDLRGRQPSSSSRNRDDDRRRESDRKSSPSKRSDNRPASEHPRALLQPDKYRYTGNSSRDLETRSSDRDRRRSDSEHRSSSSSNRSRGDDRPTSEHPRAMRQPDKYRYTGGGGDRSEKRSSKGKKD